MSEKSENIMYLTPSCPYCNMARRLLDAKGVSYEVINVAGSTELWQEIADKTGRNTVPQIFIKGHHVGGFDDLSAAENTGELDKLLA